MAYPIKTLQQLRPLLISLRKQAGLTQKALAEQLGITQQSYAQLEAQPSLSSVERFYMVLRLLGAELALSQDAEYSNDIVGNATMPPTVKRRAKAPPKNVPPPEQQEIW